MGIRIVRGEENEARAQAVTQARALTGAPLLQAVGGWLGDLPGALIGSLLGKGGKLLDQAALMILATVLKSIQGTPYYNQAVQSVADSIHAVVPGDDVVEPALGQFLVDLGNKIGHYGETA